MAKLQIGLDVPERRKPDKHAFDIRAKKLESWIADLPRANLGETARLVYRLLADTNHLQFSHQDRMYFLEAMREPVFYITSSMKKYYVGANFPLSDKNYKVATACREIFSTLATGYKIACEDLLANSLFYIDKKLLSKMIHRSLSSLGHVLLIAYQTYEHYPRNIWKDIHRLYYFAEKEKLIHNEVSDAHRKHNLHSSIQAEYLRLLMLHLASPYRLRQGEIGRVFSTLEHWSTVCKLLAPSDQPRHAQFAVNLLGNSPPRSLALTTERRSDTECRIIDTTALAATVERELKNSANMATTTLPGLEIQRNELSHDLLRCLLLAWGVVPKRLFPRSNTNEKLRITLGLSSTHKVISDGNYLTGKDPSRYPGRVKDKFVRTAQFNTSSISNANDRQPDVWDLIYPDNTGDNSQIAEEPLLDHSQNNIVAEKIYSHIETWTMQNQSASGYCISTKASGDTNIQVGDLIGIQRIGDGRIWKWGIGVIRWMKQETEQDVILGVEMLTPDAAAIGIKSAFPQSDEDYKRTLLLPELPSIKQPKTLITGPIPFRVGNHLTMRILGKAIGITLTRQVQNTGFFAQFEFDIVEQQKESGNKKEQDDSDDFDSIWSII